MNDFSGSAKIIFVLKHWISVKNLEVKAVPKIKEQNKEWERVFTKTIEKDIVIQPCTNKSHEFILSVLFLFGWLCEILQMVIHPTIQLHSPCNHTFFIHFIILIFPILISTFHLHNSIQ